MSIFEKINESMYLTALVVFISLFAIEFFRYVKQLHYNNDINNNKMKNHYLNTKYHLDKKKNVDLKKINRDIFLSHLLGELIGCIIIAFFNRNIGIISVIVLATVFNYFAMTRIGKSYSSSK